MKFYRNLGAITFQSETPTFQIFTAAPATVVFQIKQPETPASVLEDIVATLNQHYHCNLFRLYSQPHKGQCILLTNSRKIEVKGIDTNHLCTLLMEAAKIIHKSSQILPEWVGNCSLHQFRMIGDKVGFVYLPLLREEQKNKFQTKIIHQFMGMISQIIDVRDVSQKLLFRKLQKCKGVLDIIEEIGYFSNVYCVGRIKLHESRKLLLPTSNKKYPTKSVKKIGIFKLDLLKPRKSQNSFRSHHQYSLSQHRQSMNAMHISLPFTVKHHSSAHTSQQRSSLNKTDKRESFSKVSRVSLKNSQVKEDKGEKERVIKRQSKLKQALYTPVNSMDEEKLLKKLRNKKKAQAIINCEEIAGVKPVIIAETKLNQPIEQTSEKTQQKFQIEYKKIQSTKQIESNGFESTKPIHPIKQATNKKNIDSPTAKENSRTTKNTSKNGSPLDTPLNTPNYKETSNLKKMKKKKSLQDISDQLEVIDLGNKSRQKTTIKTNQSSTKKGQALLPQYSATVENAWNKEKSLVCQQEQTKRVSRAMAADKLVKKCRRLNLMGTAVANTKGHLSNYQNIFWQLPLFFIYRGFYIRRLQIAQQAQGLQTSSQEIAEILTENIKIKESNEKLIKTIIKKLKKMDLTLFQSLQPYLNLDKGVNCEELMKNFIKEYIDSLTEAVQKDEELITHLLEISDAYLIYRGEDVEESRRLQAQKNQQIGNYIVQQRRLLQKYI